MLKSNDVPISDKALGELRKELGLTDSLGSQYIDWLTNAFTLKWGNSYVSKESVIHELLERLPATLELALVGLLVMLSMTFILGITTASTKSRVLDRVGKLFALLGAAVPTFWFGFYVYTYSQSI